nr:hypothetical protein [Vibrio cholerae]
KLINYSVAYKRETPPPAWGRRWPDDADFIQYRNTPTCVGKTIQYYMSGIMTKKHPHLRGEDVLVQLRPMH